MWAKFTMDGPSSFVFCGVLPFAFAHLDSSIHFRLRDDDLVLLVVVVTGDDADVVAVVVVVELLG